MTDSHRLPRCKHHDPSNRRCRKQVVEAGAAFCRRHASGADAEPDVSATLTAGLDALNSPAVINEFLSRLLLLLAQNRISARRAAVLAYITNQLFRGLAVQERHAARDAEPARIEYVIGIPRPYHNPPPAGEESRESPEARTTS